MPPASTIISSILDNLAGVIPEREIASWNGFLPTPVRELPLREIPEEWWARCAVGMNGATEAASPRPTDQAQTVRPYPPPPPHRTTRGYRQDIRDIKVPILWFEELETMLRPEERFMTGEGGFELITNAGRRLRFIPTEGL